MYFLRPHCRLMFFLYSEKIFLSIEILKKIKLFSDYLGTLILRPLGISTFGADSKDKPFMR